MPIKGNLCPHLMPLTHTISDTGVMNMGGLITITNMPLINRCLDCPEPVCRYENKRYDYARKGVPPPQKI